MPPLWALAVALSCLVSTFTVLGFVLQTQAVRDPEQRKRYPKVGDIVISPCWVMGVLLQAVPNFLGDAVVYTIAPLSLTAPLSGFSVALNTSLAPRLLGERLHRWPDLPATALILVGLVLTTGSGPHQDHVPLSSIGTLAELALRPMALGLLGCLVLSLSSCASWQYIRSGAIEREAEQSFESPRLSHLLMPAWCGAGAGCVTNIGMKVFGEFVASGTPFWQVACTLLVAVLPPAVIQQQCVNRGLRLYPQTVFFPVYSSLLVLSNTVLGGVFFEEYFALERERYALLSFATGLAIIVAGIVLFSLRGSKLPGATKLPLEEVLL